MNYHESFNFFKYYNVFTEAVLSLTYCRIAEAYNYLNINKKAYQFYLKSVEISPNNLDFLLKTAVLEIKMSKFEQSKIRLKKIIRLNPNFEKAYYNLGIIYVMGLFWGYNQNRISNKFTNTF